MSKSLIYIKARRGRPIPISMMIQKKQRLPRKIKKKWKKMGVKPVFKGELVIDVPILSKIDRDRMLKAKYPEKQLAKNKISHLKTETKGNHFHHWSYNEEHYKDVIEISEKNHNIAHRNMIYDQERMMYRTTSGVLLDTKESHRSYIAEKVSEDQLKRIV